MNTSLSKIGKVVAAGAVIGTISIAGVAYNSNKQAILEQINQLKTKANQWQKQAGDNKYELQQQQEKYNSIIAQLKDKLGLDIADGATAEEIATALQNYVDSTSSKTDVDTYNTAISSIANSLGLELTDADKDEKGMYDYTLITGELSKLDDAITELNKLITDEEIDTTGNTEGSNADDASLVAKINYLINQINLANKDQNDLLKTAQQYDDLVSEADENYISTLKYAVTFKKGQPIKASGTSDISDSFKSTLNTQTANTVKILNEAGILGATEGMEVTVQPYFRTTDDDTGVADTTNKYRMLVSDDGYNSLYAYAQEHPENEKLKIVNGELLMYTTTTMTDADRKGMESAHGDDMYENCWNTNYKPVVSNSMVGR